MMQGTKVQAVLDWEFSGSYPLNELVGGGIGIDVLEIIDDESGGGKFEVELKNCEDGS